MVNCRLCADSVLGVHVHQLRQQAEKGVSRFDGGDAFAHHEVDDASLAEPVAHSISVIMFGHFTEQCLSKKKVRTSFSMPMIMFRGKLLRRSACSIILRCSALSSRLEQSLPVSSSMIKQPIDHISHEYDHPSPRMISGAR